MSQRRSIKRAPKIGRPLLEQAIEKVGWSLQKCRGRAKIVKVEKEEKWGNERGGKEEALLA